LTSARSCNYCCTSSWWWVSTPETCRAVYRNIINWIQSHLFGQLLNLFSHVTRCTKIQVKTFKLPSLYDDYLISVIITQNYTELYLMAHRHFNRSSFV